MGMTFQDAVSRYQSMAATYTEPENGKSRQDDFGCWILKSGGDVFLASVSPDGKVFDGDGSELTIEGRDAERKEIQDLVAARFKKSSTLTA